MRRARSEPAAACPAPAVKLARLGADPAAALGAGRADPHGEAGRPGQPGTEGDEHRDEQRPAQVGLEEAEHGVPHGGCDVAG